jgi:hypothetical protein
MKRLALLGVLVMGLGIPGEAQEPWNCAQPEFRQFDFWLGTWDMQDRRSGTRLGTAKIVKVHGGCAIREDWQALSGGSGANIATYHPPIKRWRMVSVTRNGGHFLSEGEFTNGTLSFLTDARPRDGKPERRRISWSQTDNPNRVLQVWEVSSDDRTWVREFDGVCLRQP